MHTFFRVAIAVMAFVPETILGQTTFLSLGARSAGMAHASVSLKDPWAGVNNIAGTGFVKDMAIASCFEHRYGLSNLNTGAMVFVIPLRHLSLAASLAKFGDLLYSEQCLGLGISHTFSSVSLGLKVNYLQVHADESYTRHAFITEVGGMATISHTWSFGVHLFNANLAKMNNGTSEVPLPIVMKSGLSYFPHPKIILSMEVFKQLDYQASCRIGLEYSVIKKLSLRSGISTFPFIQHVGVGFSHRNFTSDCAFSYHGTLGPVLHLSLCYQISRKINASAH